MVSQIRYYQSDTALLRYRYQSSSLATTTYGNTTLWKADLGGMSTDSPRVAGRRYGPAGFALFGIAPGEDGPLLGRWETTGYQGEFALGGFVDSCRAVPTARWALGRARRSVPRRAHP